MSGVKGRSGRKTNYQSIDFEKLVQKSFEIQMRFFDDENVPDEKKIEYASRYLAKRVGEKIDIAVSHALDSNQMNELYERISSRYLPQP